MTDALAIEGVSLLAAATVGFLGGVHCVGMCGGIVGALTLGLAPETRAGRGRALRYHLGYNFGRIASYTLAGALAGGVGWFVSGLGELRIAQLALQLFAGLMMLALGAYLSGIWMGLTRVERMGAVLWRRIEPLGRRLLPVRSVGGAMRLGLLWGWLPCGLVYSVLVWAIASGSAAQGAALMLAFGLGTLPNLLATGLFANALVAFTRRPWVKMAAGLLVAAFGAWSLWLAARALWFSA
jgi:sulfite exporter TauE/SafE